MKVNSSHSLVSHCTSSSLGILNSTHGMKLTPKTPPEKRSWLMTLSFFFFTWRMCILQTKMLYCWLHQNLKNNIINELFFTKGLTCEISQWTPPQDPKIYHDLSLYGMQVVPVFTLGGPFDFKMLVTKFCSLGKVLLA